MSLEQNFISACEQVKKFTKRPPDSDMLQIYSLYKQATVGNNNIARPIDTTSKLKWDAWNSRKGLSREEAKQKYVELVENFASKYE